MLKENKGVTLVALVITIIVLLILAGVSIAMVAGDNGVLNQAVSASEKTAGATAKEELSQAISGLQADFYADVYGGNMTAKFSRYITEADLAAYMSDGYELKLTKYTKDQGVVTDAKDEAAAGCIITVKYKDVLYQAVCTWTKKDNGMNLVDFYACRPGTNDADKYTVKAESGTGTEEVAASVVKDRRALPTLNAKGEEIYY